MEELSVLFEAIAVEEKEMRRERRWRAMVGSVYESGEYKGYIEAKD